MREVAAVFVALLAAGCSSQAAPPAPATGVSNQLATSSPPPIDSSSLNAAARALDADQRPPAPQFITLTGTVLETMDSGGYTYLRLKTADGEAWAAVQKAVVKKGSPATVVNGVTMTDFESKTLKRKFASIVFGSLGSGAPTAPAGEMDAETKAHIAEQHAGVVSGTVSPEMGGISVKRAEGPDARTVAEVFAGKATLKDKVVTLRGKVVKYNPGIMGRNWIHLRDGSGSHDKKDDDITATTADGAALGDVIVVRGTVHLDRDFGAGYAYPVIIEDARITR
jgi:hypothetical protein